jgi:hypothetical protein
VGSVSAWLFRFGVSGREWKDAIQEIYWVQTPVCIGVGG